MYRKREVISVTKPHVLPEISRLIASYIDDDRNEFISYAHEWFDTVKNQYVFGDSRLEFIIRNEYAYVFIKLLSILPGAPTHIFPINKMSHIDILKIVKLNYNDHDIDYHCVAKFIYDFIQIFNVYIG